MRAMLTCETCLCIARVCCIRGSTVKAVACEKSQSGGEDAWEVEEQNCQQGDQHAALQLIPAHADDYMWGHGSCCGSCLDPVAGPRPVKPPPTQ